jgi:hypothetical protein
MERDGRAREERLVSGLGKCLRDRTERVWRERKVVERLFVRDRNNTETIQKQGRRKLAGHYPKNKTDTKRRGMTEKENYMSR